MPHLVVFSRSYSSPDETVSDHKLEEIDGRCIARTDEDSPLDSRLIGENHEVSLGEELDDCRIFRLAKNESPPCPPFRSRENDGLHLLVVQEVPGVVRGNRLDLLGGDEERRQDSLWIVIRPLEEGA